LSLSLPQMLTEKFSDVFISGRHCPIRSCHHTQGELPPLPRHILHLIVSPCLVSPHDRTMPLQTCSPEPTPMTKSGWGCYSRVRHHALYRTTLTISSLDPCIAIPAIAGGEIMSQSTI
jgi:hypothetical protein